MRNRRTVLAVVASFACAACSGRDEPEKVVRAQAALTGGCVATSFVDASISGAPESGQQAPDLVVPVESQLTLIGVARQVDIASDCRVTVRKLAASWRLTYRPPNGMPIDATAALSVTPVGPGLIEGMTWTTSAADEMRATLSPQAGRYRAELVDGTTGLVLTARMIHAGNCGDDAWFNIGPEVDTSTCVQSNTCTTGQVADIAFDPDNADRAYRAAIGGGVWRSDDFGDSWHPTTSDTAGLPAQLVITRVAALRKQGSETIGRVLAGVDIEGRGSYIPSIYLSPSGGSSWRLPAGCSNDSSSALPRGPATRIVADPTNSNVVYASTWNGVYVSNDRGECWKNVTGNLLAGAQPTIEGHTFPMDLAIVDEDGTPTLWAAVSPAISNPTVCDVVRRLPNPTLLWSRTQADLNSAPPSWTKTVTCTSAQTIPYGVTHAIFARSREVVNGVVHDDVFTLIPQGGDLVVFESRWAGLSRFWNQRTNPTDNGCSTASGGSTQCTGLCNYGQKLAFAVDPNDPTQLLVGTAYQVMRSSNRGVSWNTFLWRDWSRFNAQPGGWHPDSLVLRYQQRNGGKYAFWGNDGGAFAIRMDIQPAVVSGCPAPEPTWLDCSIPFNCWTHRNHGVATDLFYRDSSAISPNGQYLQGTGGGLQDNNNRTRVQRLNFAASSWKTIDGGGDGGYQAFDALDPDLIYANFYGPFQGDHALNRWRVSTAAAEARVGFARGVWTHPTQPWLLAARDPNSTDKGQLYLSEDAAQSGGEATWRCVDPTPGNLEDEVLKVVFSPDDNRAFVLVKDHANGRTAVYRLLLGTYNSAGTCGSGSTVQGLETVVDPGAGIGPIRDIAVDWATPSDLYLALTPASGQPSDRIQHAVRGTNGGYTRASIAGADPRFAPLTNTWVNPIDDNWRISNHPTLTHLLYVGTENGMFIGTKTGADDTTWTWRQSHNFPTTVVTNVLPTEGENRYPGTVRATTYGRSVWELRRCSPPPVSVPLPIPAYPYMHPPHMGLGIDYAYDGVFGPQVLMTVQLLNGPEVAPYFLAESVRVGVGSGRLLIGVAYAGAQAPLSLETTGAVVELRALDGTLLRSTPYPLGSTWRRSDTRALELQPQAHADEGLEPVAVSYTINRPGAPSQVASGSEIVALPQNASVSITVPAVLELGEGRLALFKGWLPATGPTGGPAGAPVGTSGTTATVTMSADLLLSPIYAPPESPCDDGTVEESFGTRMAGCAGVTTWPDRASLCGTGYHACSSSEWVGNRGGSAPSHNYWTDDNLGYGGSGPNSCSASPTGYSCGTNQPMRVCSGTLDAEGNACNWTGCGLSSTSPNQYFGGCVGNTTAGTLCCKSTPACSDGSIEQTFPGSTMFGCAGAASWPNRGSLCAAGTHVCSAAEYVSRRGGAAPTHNYWTSDNLGYGGAGSGSCYASPSGASCGANQPMRACAGGSDAEGNVCNWTSCGLGTSAPNQYLGGCVGNTTAGAVCCTD